VLDRAQRKLPAAALSFGLSYCCPAAPEAVKEAVSRGAFLAQSELKRCLVCAGVASNPGDVAAGIEEGFHRDEALACHAASAAPDDLPEAHRAIGRIGDSLLADQARLELVRLLAEHSRYDRAATAAEAIEDPYLSVAAMVELLPACEDFQAALEQIDGRLSDVKDGWRKRDLLSRLVPIVAGKEWRLALKYVFLVEDLVERRAVLAGVVRQIGQPELSGAATIKVEFPDARVRAEWCLLLAASMIVGTGSSAGAPERRPGQGERSGER